MGDGVAGGTVRGLSWVCVVRARVSCRVEIQPLYAYAYASGTVRTYCTYVRTSYSNVILHYTQRRAALRENGDVKHVRIYGGLGSRYRCVGYYWAWHYAWSTACRRASPCSRMTTCWPAVRLLKLLCALALPVMLPLAC